MRVCVCVCVCVRARARAYFVYLHFHLNDTHRRIFLFDNGLMMFFSFVCFLSRLFFTANMVSGSPLFVTALLLASVLFCTCDLSLVDGDADGGVYRQRRNPYGEQAATCQRAATNMLNQVSCEPADISSVPFFFITGRTYSYCKTDSSISV